MSNEEAIKILKEVREEVLAKETELSKQVFENLGIKAIDLAIKALEQTELNPSYNSVKTELEPRWIPVSEKLPEDHKDVLICLSSDQICIGCYNSHKLPFSNNVIGWGASYAHNWCNNDVIAWMPLPKPYKESEDKE